MANWYSQSGYRNAAARGAAIGGLSLPSPAPMSPSPLGPLKYTPPPMPANTGMGHGAGMYGKIAGRGVVRFIPWLGWALTAYELWDLYRKYGYRVGLYLAGYAPNCASVDCAGSADVIATEGNACGLPRCAASDLSGYGPVLWNKQTYPPVLHIWRFSHEVLEFGVPDGRWRGIERWAKSATAPRPRVMPYPHPDPWHEPEPWGNPLPDYVPSPGNPGVDPGVSPIGQPAPAPAPVPWRAIPELDPWPRGPVPEVEVPTEWSPPGEVVYPPVPVGPPAPAPGPSPEPGRPPRPNKPPRPNWPPRPVPSPGPVPGPRGNPTPSPGPTPVPGPSSPPVARPGPVFKPKPRRRMPPKPREREVKKKLTSQGWAVFDAFVNTATESMDFISAVWWALPAQYRSPPVFYGGKWHQPDPVTQAKDVYRHLDKVDWEKAWRNVLFQHVQDMAIGKVGGALGKGNQAADAFTGFDAIKGWGTGPAL